MAARSGDTFCGRHERHNELAGDGRAALLFSSQTQTVRCCDVGEERGEESV